MKTHVALWLLALITIGVFGRAMGYEFIAWDDPHYVYENPHVREGLSWAGIKWILTEQPSDARHPLRAWHPLTGLSHMLDCELFGLNPAGHHAVNILLHAINVLLLYGVMWSLTRRRWAAMMVAALFGLHPLRVESVAWIAERKDVLSGCFGLLTIWAYVAYSRRGGFFRYLLVWVLLALGLMAKPMLVTWPALLLLLDYWPLRRIRRWQPEPGIISDHAYLTDPSFLRARSLGRLVIEKLPLLALALVSGITTFLFHRALGPTLPGDLLPMGERLSNAIVSCVRYLGKMFWPADLTVLYPHPYLPGGEPWARWQIAGAAGLLLLISVGCVWQMRRRAYLIVGWLWYLGTLVPVLGVAQAGSQAMADRFTYLPSIGITIMLVGAAVEIFAAMHRRPATRSVAATSAAIILIACAALSFHQIRYWRDSIALFSHAIEVAPNAAIMHTNLGDLHRDRWKEQSAANEIDHAERHFDHALARYRDAARLVPTDAPRRMTYINLLVEIDEYDLVIRQLRDGLDQLRPGFDDAWRGPIRYSLANALRQTDRIDEAIESCQQAALDSPEAPPMQEAVQHLLALRQQLDQQIAQLQSQLDMKPEDPPTMMQLAAVLKARGRPTQAASLYRHIVERQPTNADAHYRLGVTLASEHLHDQAVASLLRAAELKPDWPDPFNAAAWILATRPDAAPQHAQQAVELAQQSCSMTHHDNPAYLDTLAAAHAGAGDFTQAKRVAARAADLAMSRAQIKLARQIRYRLTFHQQSMPIRRQPSD